MAKLAQAVERHGAMLVAQRAEVQERVSVVASKQKLGKIWLKPVLHVLHSLIMCATCNLQHSHISVGHSRYAPHLKRFLPALVGPAMQEFARRLREEQNEEYERSLAADREREARREQQRQQEEQEQREREEAEARVRCAAMSCFDPRHAISRVYSGLSWTAATASVSCFFTQRHVVTATLLIAVQSLLQCYICLLYAQSVVPPHTQGGGGGGGAAQAGTCAVHSAAQGGQACIAAC